MRPALRRWRCGIRSSCVDLKKKKNSTKSSTLKIPDHFIFGSQESFEIWSHLCIYFLSKMKVVANFIDFMIRQCTFVLFQS